jgi:predicted transcriptional regulator
MTIRLDDQLHAEAKRWAAETGRTLSAVIEDALREVLARRKIAAKTERIRLISLRAGVLQPGVNLDNSAELLDIMERSGGDA